MLKTQYLLKKYSPLILTTLGSIGVISTTILAVKATPKALELINKEENSRNEYLSNLEKVKVAWKPYIPAIISGFTTISCIYGAHYLNSKAQASLASAYTFLDNSYKQYIAKTKELYGEDADKKIKEEMAKDNYNDRQLLNGDSRLFFDYQSLRYFENDINSVLKAENELNNDFAAHGLVTLNDFYKHLGIEPVDYGNDIGWYDEGNYFEIQFEHEKMVFDDGLECYSVTILNAPDVLPPFYSRD